MGHVVVHRMSYYIYFLLVYAVQMPLRIKKMHKSRRVDVMLHTVSPPRGEAASPPSPRCRYSKKALTLAALMLHCESCSSRRYPSLFLSGAGISRSCRRRSNVSFISSGVSNHHPNLTRMIWSTLGTAQTSVGILGSSFPYRDPFQ
jgi:hypothetical protein